MYASELLLASFAAFAVALPQGYGNGQNSYADNSVDWQPQQYDTSRGQNQQQGYYQPQQQQWQPQKQQSQNWGQKQAQTYGQQKQSQQQQQQAQQFGQSGASSKSQNLQQADHSQGQNQFQQSGSSQSYSQSNSASSSSSSYSSSSGQGMQVSLNFDTTPSSQDHAYEQQNASVNQLTKLDSPTQASQVVVIKDAEIELDIDQLVCQVFTDPDGTQQVGNDFSANEPCDLGEQTVQIQSVKCWIS